MHAVQRSPDRLNLSNTAIRATIVALTIAGSVALAAHTALAKTFYLDGNLVANCGSNPYSIANRACGGLDGDAYNTLDGAIGALAGGDTLYVRSGTYVRTTNNYFVGALSVNASGTASKHTVVSGYANEQPEICTQSGKCLYNPSPSDTTFVNSSHYYPNPAISIGGTYIDVIGFKTYGQVLIRGASNVALRDSDLGGGGPHLNQGQVIMIHTASNIVIENNRIHHSSWGESDVNGAAIMGYEFGDVFIQNNEFYDNWSADIRLKDTRNQQGRSVTIRYNFFKPSSLRANSGVQGINQYDNLDYIYIHNNIFYNKSIGISWDDPPLGAFAYNNTFVNNGRDIFNWMLTPMNVANNLHYHSTGSQHFLYLENSLFNLSGLTSNYSVFYSTTGDTKWQHGGTSKTTLSTWQTYSGKDGASTTKNPGFVNSGSRPEDFKRTSYAGDVTGSSYGTVAGAYETGNELIGLTGGASSPGTMAPSAPTGLTVN